MYLKSYGPLFPLVCNCLKHYISMAMVSFCLILFSFSAVLAEEESARDKASKLLNIMGMDQELESLKDRMFDAQYQRKPKLRAYKDIIEGFFNEKFSYRAMQSALTELCLKEFSSEELDAAIQFYSTPAGRKVINLLPKVKAESLKLAHKQAIAALPELNKKIAAEARKFEPDLDVTPIQVWLPK